MLINGRVRIQPRAVWPSGQPSETPCHTGPLADNRCRQSCFHGDFELFQIVPGRLNSSRVPEEVLHAQHNCYSNSRGRGRVPLSQPPAAGDRSTDDSARSLVRHLLQGPTPALKTLEASGCIRAQPSAGPEGFLLSLSSMFPNACSVPRFLRRVQIYTGL